ncbi:transcriptional regulator, LacI family [Granulicella rosea]|uniref:Transcriptional regulator, LacI family n=1 Tax=Granulicella rosea TaxID=474952 RepID=A0A239LY00_9BACT|nr:LacI family DNA-binding transcriptional regulator [Granulicella rosea]SNT35140.1 transcriptional regulator, LacI family [Granulicella rosea]
MTFPSSHVANTPSVTLREVALRADVSLKTASRVLNGEPGVRKATEDRVRDAMRELRFRPNEAARALAAGKSRVIGVMVPSLALDFMSRCVEEIHKAVYETGRTVSLVFSDNDPAREQQNLRTLLHRRVDGVILFPTDSAWSAAGVDLDDTPLVALDIPTSQRHTASISVNNREASAAAVEHLAGHGYRSLGIVGAGPKLKTIQDRVEGASTAARKAKMAASAMLVEREDELTVEAILSRFDPLPRCFFALNSSAAEAVVRAVRSRGLRIPHDVAIVGFDDFRTADLVADGLTAIRQPVEELARMAVRLLLEKAGPEPGPQSHVLPTELILRRSCGCGNG